MVISPKKIAGIKMNATLIECEQPGCHGRMWYDPTYLLASNPPQRLLTCEKCWWQLQWPDSDEDLHLEG